MNKIKHIHFVGIKGVGMAPLAIIAKQAGFSVTGSDIDEEFITDASLKKAGIEVLKGFDKTRVEKSDLVITTGAHGGFDNEECKKAKEQGIPVWTQGEAVGRFMQGEFLNRNFEGISVSGSHGKTTTTAIIATILKENNFDPSYLIGTSEIESLSSSGHLGKGKYFVVEADEYATEPKHDKTPKFLWHKTKIGIITNIEFDHPDLYDSLESVRSAFLKFSENIDRDGVFIACIDDLEVTKLLKDYKGKVITYGFSKTADLYIEKISMSQEKMFFWVNAEETSLGEFALNITGEHNGLNALSAIAACLELGLSIESIKKGLLAFKGTKRRFEFIGETRNGALLYDDYAHHPTEISKTLIALRKMFPKKKIVCVFQPHTYSRTKSLFQEFTSSFSSADVVVFTNTYASLRDEVDDSFSSQRLAESVRRIHKDVLYIPKLEDVVKYFDEKSFGKDSVIITMGAGDIYKIAKELI